MEIAEGWFDMNGPPLDHCNMISMSKQAVLAGGTSIPLHIAPDTVGFFFGGGAHSVCCQRSRNQAKHTGSELRGGAQVPAMASRGSGCRLAEG